MREIIFQKTKTITTFEELTEVIIIILKDSHQKANNQLGYVSGIITSDGPDYIKRNFKVLEKYTEKLRQTKNYPIFSATDIFHTELLSRLNGGILVDHHFLKFWREVLESGYVTDIYMTPGWERSVGAKDEYETAKNRSLKIHYLK
jgi:hypothetical protein